MNGKVKVLVIGGGAREHAIVWKLRQDRRIGEIYVAPGNGITLQILIEITDISALASFALKKGIDYTVVGPENSLACGIVDIFESKGLSIFGPTRDAAMIESSKVFAKKLMEENRIPTASFRVFTRDEYEEALNYIKENELPIVIKVDGLAFGKGVYVCKTINEAKNALGKIMKDGAHGNAGNEIVIEEFLKGKELSMHAFCDGETIKLMPPVQDYKSILEYGKGENTGGMGSYGRSLWVTDELMSEIEQVIVKPIIKGLNNRGISFTGCLFPGLMITPDGPKLLEVNARFGDPETEVLMRLLKTNLLDILKACDEKTLADIEIEWSKDFAVCVIAASGGYPNEYKTGYHISGISKAKKILGVEIFHGGTIYKNGYFFTSGGRVLAISAKSSNLPKAISRAYAGIEKIKFEEMNYRTDIGK